MKKILLLVFAALLAICGLTLVFCFSNTKESTEVSATDDSSQFVTITDVVQENLTRTKRQAPQGVIFGSSFVFS